MAESASPINTSTPLTSERNVFPLYDANSMLNMSSDVAHGYVVLLSGEAYAPEAQQESSKNKPKTSPDTPKTTLESQTPSFSSESDIMLGFLALTEGTVIDSCFGVKNSPRNVESDDDSTSSSAKQKKHIRALKSVLSEASYTSEAIPKIAVDAYRAAFQEVLNFQREVDKLNFFSFCFRYGKLQCKSQASLKRIFQQLEETLLAST